MRDLPQLCLPNTRVLPRPAPLPRGQSCKPAWNAFDGQFDATFLDFCFFLLVGVVVLLLVAGWVFLDLEGVAALTRSQRPFLIWYPLPHTSGQIRTFRSFRLSKRSCDGSRDASANLPCFAKELTARSVLRPQMPSALPAGQPTRFSSFWRDRTNPLSFL